MSRIANEEYPFPGFYTAADYVDAKKGGLNFYFSHRENEPETCFFTREYGDGVENFFAQNSTVRIKREWGESALLGQAIDRAEGHDLRAHGLDFRCGGLDTVYGTPGHHIGSALWCGFDHQRGYHPDPFMGGLLDGARIPRYSYYLFKSQYDPDYRLPGIESGPMVKILHELTMISPADVVVYSNCEEVRLTWMGKEVETRKPDANLRMPHPPFTFRNAFNFGEMKFVTKRKSEGLVMVAEGLIGGKVVVREEKKYPERTVGIALIVDDLGLGLTSDGSDFVPIRATVVDNKGVPRVLATENVYFEVEGPGEIIDGPMAQRNPARTEFGVATALLRATTTPGKIRVKAWANGLEPGEIVVVSEPPALPLCFDVAYASAVRVPKVAQSAIQQSVHSGMGSDVAKLRRELYDLQLEHTAMQQELMELRSQSAFASPA